VIVFMSHINHLVTSKHGAQSHFEYEDFSNLFISCNSVIHVTISNIFLQ